MQTNLELDEKKLNTIKLRILQMETDNIVKKECFMEKYEKKCDEMAPFLSLYNKRDIIWSEPQKCHFKKRENNVKITPTKGGVIFYG